AFVKCYSDEAAEKGVGKVREIIGEAQKGSNTLVSSVIMVGEVVSALDKWVRKKLLTTERFDEALSEFSKDVKLLVEHNSLLLEDVTSVNITFIVDYVVKHHLPVNDAIHLYTALVNKDKIDAFMSSDKNLNTAAKAEGLTVLNPED
ncbi:type II toxin-antitoxin system VapC family toxin, partial [Candidatus Woesearchaeota archaeon]|nr:type II toxin-antitoxin system VapC family toxin [Candidatus Woesearchaeota archaeon]